MKSVLMCVPAYGGQMSELTTVSLFKTAQKFTREGIDHSLLTTANESLICRGRSRLFNFFYHRTNYDKFLFIDSDVRFAPEDVEKLLELDVDVCAAGVPLKSTTPTYNFGTVTTNGKLIWNSNKTAFEADFVGTAFMMIDRKVFEEMARAYPKLRYKPDTSGRYTNKPADEIEARNSFHFFNTYICQQTGDIRSEDYAFCDRWRDIGGKIWIRPDIQLSHVGSHEFVGTNLEETFNLYK